MVAFFRQFLVVLLVLLKNALPLVHAHSGGDDRQRGVHLAEFESLRFTPEQMSMAKTEHERNLSCCIVHVGSAIRLQLISRDVPCGFCLLLSAPTLPAAYFRHIANAVTPPNVPSPQPFLSQNGTRAPPFKPT